MHSPSSLVRVGSVPRPSSTPHSISRPKTAASTMTLGSCSRAASIAVSSPSGSATRVMPMLDPARAGLTNTGHDRPCTASIAAALSRRHSLSVMTTYGPTGSPAAARTTFMTCLSIITADAVTPDPTYLTSARSSRPWIVPSSPNGTVQQREDDVDLPERARRRTGLVHHQGAVGRARRHDDARGRPVDLGDVSRGQPQRLRVIGHEDPVAVPGDADGHDVVPVAVERLEDAGGRRARHGVLGGPAAEDESHPGPARLPLIVVARGAAGSGRWSSPATLSADGIP